MKHTYTIEIEPGSDFQEQVITQLFDNFFSVMQEMLPYKHKKNKVTITKK